MGIHVSELTKQYGPQNAVDHISFEVATGEIVGFLGPNGAGKSTTMRMLTCYLSPTSGTADVEGFNIHKNPEEVRRSVGYLPENNPLYEDMTIVDYLTFTAQLQKVPKADILPNIRNMVDICGLGRERHKYIGELSKGYRQRVGLAQALIHDPDVLILDEPTTGLDPNQIIEIRELIRRIGREKTVMLSSHILKEVEMTCDRILIINKGKLVADDSTENLGRRVKGADRIRIELRTDLASDDVAKAIADLPSVAGCLPGDKPGRFEVDSHPDTDIRKDIFALCVQHAWIIDEMTTLETSLEDTFRELTIDHDSTS